MKIDAIRTYVLKAPTKKSFYSSQGLFAGRKSLLVEIITDEGIVGWGEGGQYGPAEPVRACIDAVLAPALIGQNPLTPSVHWDKMYATNRDFGTKGPYLEALSALDIAMWDITGKYHSARVADLLGGARRESVAAYGTGFYYPGDAPDRVDPGQIEAEAAAKLEIGFDMLKAKIGLLSIEEDRKRLELIRQYVGTGVDLLVDCNHAYTFNAARRMGDVLADLGVLWFEEPVVPEDKAGYRKLRDVCPVAVAGGEAEYGRFGFASLILGGCVDIAQPDLCVSGGISEWIKIQAVASVTGVTVVPHIWGSGVALGAALQVLSATPPSVYTARSIPLLNEPVMEFDTTDNPLRSELITVPFALEEGR
ncbi:MAG: mandelate racemase/muconate lactonizing enzyme family protein, partial [Propionicimonas sp.]|nr:mandelate racemase/muconate lactonizing enzyme family protein [Propionicimonas sp.]